jgi:hypothetical protein
MASPQFEGWIERCEGVYAREVRRQGVTALVSRPDGWNWGWLILGNEGVIVVGNMTSKLDPFTAVASAERYLVDGTIS